MTRTVSPTLDSHCHFWRLSRGDYGWLDGTGGPLADIVFRLIDWFGPDRLIWGWDWPVLRLAASHDSWIGLTALPLQGLAEAERATILGGNARRFYKLAGPDWRA